MIVARSSGHCFDHLFDSDEVDYSFEVVTQDRQAHLCAHLVQTSHQKETVAHRPLDGAERRLGKLLPPPHYFWPGAHSAGHVFQQLLIYPTTDPPSALIRGAL